MLPEKDSYILIYKESSILLKNTEEGIVYPTFGEIERWNTDIYVRAIYLFSVDDRNFYYVKDIGYDYAEFMGKYLDMINLTVIIWKSCRTFAC